MFATIDTPCGIRAIGRQCQNLSVPAVSASHPLNPVCKAPGEAVHIIEDDAAAQEELAEIVRNFGFDVRLYPSAHEFQLHAPQIDAGCVVLDIRLPGMDGITLYERLKETGFAVPVIFLTGMEDVATAVTCMRAGAHDYIVKPAREIELRRSIASAIGSARMHYCKTRSRDGLIEQLSRLTPAEHQVATMLAEGYITKQIASKLSRSENTIKIHRSKVMQKLRINSTAMLANIFSMASE